MARVLLLQRKGMRAMTPSPAAQCGGDSSAGGQVMQHVIAAIVAAIVAILVAIQMEDGL
jgi:hypothetical protein